MSARSVILTTWRAALCGLPAPPADVVRELLHRMGVTPLRALADASAVRPSVRVLARARLAELLPSAPRGTVARAADEAAEAMRRAARASRARAA